MITLIIGGSGSGKSEYAESLVTALPKQYPRYYLATMKVWDEESKARIVRHRELRAGKGFATIEIPVDIANAAKTIEHSAVLLLECLSNLLANEMFGPMDDGGKCLSAEETLDKIGTEIVTLAGTCEELIIVSNNIFEDGTLYSKETMEYIRALGMLNAYIAKRATKVIEVVAGIPIPVKKEGR